jgi:hypothetical protein
MLLIDVIAVMVAIGIIFGATAGVRSLRRKAVPEIKGAENAEKVKAAFDRRCASCGKDTNFETDIYVNNGKWLHKDCYLKLETDVDKLLNDEKNVKNKETV